MDYLFLHRDKRTFTSERQRNLLFRAARLYWEQKYADSEVVPKRKVDCELYKYVLYYLEVRQVFLDPKLSLKKLSDMIETNQTYLSNVVNRYFGCHLKELVNTYRVEYAKELLRSGKCPPEELPQRCGFLSRSAFYAAFKKVTGVSPKRYMKYGSLMVFLHTESTENWMMMLRYFRARACIPLQPKKSVSSNSNLRSKSLCISVSGENA